MEQEQNIIQLKCWNLLEKGIQLEATDIHLLPRSDHYEVTFQLDGKRHKIEAIPIPLARRIISYLKYLSSLDISDQRKPQSGAFHQQFGQHHYSFRISTIPSIHATESTVIRLQQHNKVVSLQQLCTEPQWAEQLQRGLAQKQGLIISTGPTGSGKTTTLYSMTAHCAQQLGRHIISLEDPVENNHAHLLQIQVNERAGITYATGLKAILRHSPDVIVIGEIRDHETAKVAIQAALTGHLVITTVHASSSVGCFYRLIDLGVSIEELRQTIICIAAQQLNQTSSGVLQASFKITDGELLEKMKEAVARGERFKMIEDTFEQRRIE